MIYLKLIVTNLVFIPTAKKLLFPVPTVAEVTNGVSEQKNSHQIRWEPDLTSRL